MVELYAANAQEVATLQDRLQGVISYSARDRWENSGSFLGGLFGRSRRSSLAPINDQFIEKYSGTFSYFVLNGIVCSVARTDPEGVEFFGRKRRKLYFGLGKDQIAPLKKLPENCFLRGAPINLETYSGVFLSYEVTPNRV